MHLDQATQEQLRALESALSEQYQAIQSEGLSLDLTRGKPNADQLDLSNALDGILQGNYHDSTGTDLRNYGGLTGIPEARKLFSAMIGVKPDEIMIGGNSSLTLMYFTVQTCLQQDFAGEDSAWQKSGRPIKFLAPVPGYDRHFSVCQHLGVEMIPVAMDDNGPDMDQVEALLKADPDIKGIWCVPRFSNPTGCVYSDEVVQRMAGLGKIAGENFRIFWDNAYAVHTLEENAPELANLMECCRSAGTEDSVYIFGSTSKITFAGAGVAFVGASAPNLQSLQYHLGFTSIGPDKINQLRHVYFLRDMKTLQTHMQKHAAIMKPRFEAVLETLDAELTGTGMGEWTKPQGGYFISFDSRPGLAREIIKLSAGAGVKLTPAGATFPYGNDPDDKNIRLAPTFPTIEELRKAVEVFVVCVKLASVRQKLES